MDKFSELILKIQNQEIHWAISLLSLFFIPFFEGYLIVAIFSLIRDSKLGRRYAIGELSVDSKRFYRELLRGSSCYAVDALVLLIFITNGAIKFNYNPTVTEYCLSYMIIAWLYEIWFYSFHRLLHHDWFYWIHRQHHENALYPYPITAYSFSVLERSIFILVGTLILGAVSQIYPIPPMTLASFVLMAMLYNVIGHMNVELYPTWLLKTWLGRAISSATFHSFHHKYQKGHYGLFTTIFDRLFNSCFWDEYVALYNKVRAQKKD